MAGKKKEKEPKDETFAIFEFVNGPRHGLKMRLQPQPRPFVRLAFPQWCTYEWDAKEGKYIYWGTEPPPKSDEGRGPRNIPSTYIPDNTIELYRNTEAFLRGRAMAEGAVVE